MEKPPHKARAEREDADCTDHNTVIDRVSVFLLFHLIWRLPVQRLLLANEHIVAGYPLSLEWRSVLLPFYSVGSPAVFLLRTARFAIKALWDGVKHIHLLA